jgi:hypothetical protein
MLTDVDRKRAARLDVEVTRVAVIPGGIEDVFDFVAAEDVLSKILTGYGLVAGVAATSDISGPCDRPGSRRIMHLSDGSTVNEGLTKYSRPSYFSYRVGDPSFALKHLMAEARGQFWFAPTAGGTTVKWTYTFRAKNRIARLPLAFVRQDPVEGLYGRLSEKRSQALRCSIDSRHGVCAEVKGPLAS